VLLEQDTDPGLPGVHWWVTPGGGLDPGESFVEAGVRELREETGLVVTGADLIGPVARRLTHHGYTDQVLVQTEEFFVVRTERFEVDTSGYTDEERRTLLHTAWMTREEVAASTVWPSRILELWTPDGATSSTWAVSRSRRSRSPPSSGPSSACAEGTDLRRGAQRRPSSGASSASMIR